jgi:hypothetical protein
MEARRGLTLKGPYAATMREFWAGQILLADLSRADMAALVAFFESLDGRVTPFGITLATGFASAGTTASGTIDAVNPGADRVRVTVAGNPTLPAGTLLGIGATDGVYQLCEVLQQSTADGATDARIAPRIRNVFGASTPVAVGSVTGKFNLAGDDLDVAFNTSYGSLAINVIEAL